MIQWVHHCIGILPLEILHVNRRHNGTNSGDAQYFNTAGLMPSIPGALFTSRVERISKTSVVDISMSCSDCVLLLGGQVNFNFEAFKNTDKNIH